MPRRPRIHARGALYHVTLRGNHAEPIFDVPRDRTVLDEIAAEVMSFYSACAHAYCWMPNHIHLLLQVGDSPSGALMRDLAGRYSRYLQGRRGTRGALFDRRYFAQLVDNDRYLVAAASYIHLNPVRAGLAPTAAEYPYSGHLAYTQGRGPPWLQTTLVLGALAPDRAQAIAAYRALTELPGARDTPSPFPKKRRMDPQPAPPVASGHKLAELIDECCSKWGVPRAALAGNGGSAMVKLARLQITERATAGRLASLRDVAASLGCCHTTLSRGLKRRYRA